MTLKAPLRQTKFLNVPTDKGGLLWKRGGVSIRRKSREPTVKHARFSLPNAKPGKQKRPG